MVDKLSDLDDENFVNQIHNVFCYEAAAYTEKKLEQIRIGKIAFLSVLIERYHKQVGAFVTSNQDTSYEERFEKLIEKCTPKDPLDKKWLDTFLGTFMLDIRKPEAIAESVEIFKTLLSPDYSPPLDHKGIFKHLSCLFIYYDSLEPSYRAFPLSFITTVLDGALVKLTWQIGYAMRHIMVKGAHKDRTAKSHKGREPSISRMKDLVWKEYEKFRDTADAITLEETCKYKYRLAKRLQKMLHVSSPRKLDTIVKYLEEYHKEKGDLPPWEDG